MQNKKQGPFSTQKTKESVNGNSKERTNWKSPGLFGFRQKQDHNAERSKAKQDPLQELEIQETLTANQLLKCPFSMVTWGYA